MANDTNDSDRDENHKSGPKVGTRKNVPKGRAPGKSASNANGSNATNRSSGTKSGNSRGQNQKRRGTGQSRRQNWSVPEVPGWVGIAASVVGAGLAAGYFAWRNQKSGGSWGDSFNAAFAHGETDSENFDQTRNAGTSSMRDDHDDWEDIDEMNDASFPASDPPSFNPGTA